MPHLVPGHVFGLEDVREPVGAATDDEEGRVQLLLLKVVEHERRIRAGTVVEGYSPVHLSRAGDNVGIARAATTCPPAAGLVCHGVGVRSTERRVGRDGDIGDLDPVELLHPLRDFGCVGGGDLCGRRVFAAVQCCCTGSAETERERSHTHSLAKVERQTRGALRPLERWR